MVERVVPEQQTHFEATNVKISQHTSGWDSRLKENKPEFASTLSGSVVLTDDLEQLLASLGEGASLRDQIKAEAVDGSKVMSPGADGPAQAEIRSPECG